jgi:hypothetical protein
MDSNEQVQDLYNRLSKGGKTDLSTNYPGDRVILDDGTTVSIREKGTTPGLTIDVTYPDGTVVKIHVK